MTEVYALAHHADYGCRHAGACCTAGWRIPVEPERLLGLRTAVAGGRLPPSAALVESAEGATVLAMRTGGLCTAYEASPHAGSGRCAVHRALGHEALPASCRHFPRLAVLDARGTHITLSHFCPTAAASLFREDVPLAIVPAPPAFPAGAEYEGLDARDALPPLLHAAMLMDLESYTAWEHHAVATFADDRLTALAAVERLAADAAHLGSWAPGHGPLADAVRQLAVGPRNDGEHSGTMPFPEAERRHAAVIACVPPELQPTPLPPDAREIADALVLPAWARYQRPLKRYLASKAFANWVAWQGRGLAHVVASLGLALGVVQVEAVRRCREAGLALDQALLLEAFRRADDLVVHRASATLLARACERIR